MAVDEGRVCTGCATWKARDEYSTSAWNKVGTVKCKSCKSEENLRDKLQRLYGMTLDDYQALLDKQGGTCALCPATTAPSVTNPKGRLYVDHDHETGEVRGLLCISCNYGLGLLGDNEAGLLKALEYVKR